MSSVNPSSQSSGGSNGRSRWFGTGLGGDVIVTAQESRSMSLKQQQEKFGRGTEGYAERSAVRRWMNDLSDEREMSQVVADARAAWREQHATDRDQAQATERPHRHGVERSR
ncbi:hypothetical protein ACIBG0_17155 [Nocardia sp. NPDC050630]|uniref:hypothetical protein n=1 Tax=Nocardia sp. NPDC050630 TaxID=3364321 RepID=UPI00378A13CB